MSINEQTMQHIQTLQYLHAEGERILEFGLALDMVYVTLCSTNVAAG